MTWGMVAVGAGTAIAGIATSMASKNAAKSAAGAQQAAAQQGIDAQNQRFDQMQQMLLPYQQAGVGSLGAQQDLLGIGPGGASAQQAAIDRLQSMPQFQSMLAAGNNNILQAASATGGLRGGNTQGLLAGFAPGLLAQVIQQQYGNLGGITAIGQNAAAMTGNAGLGVGSNVSNLLQQSGAAQAGGDLASGKANAGIISSLMQGFGAWKGAGGTFGGTSPGTGSTEWGSLENGGLNLGGTSFGAGIGNGF